MGAAVSILIVGPIPESNGVIETRSIHVNHPGGTTGKTWPEFDPLGFQKVEDSFVRYGIANFSKLITAQKTCAHTNQYYKISPGRVSTSSAAQRL